ncbi:MAG: tRNA preQ1(34) S-adenosylmethionine ribosyltransferase-isomerase QueA [Chloroflexi bacterium]|nr:tRNA preQ1(34) S-adenosylmethionine ribosyltransferase-isomerase QueA [Chloroflexota bacterium]
MRTSDFDYDLPPQLIAQTPIEPRDHSRLMVLDRASGAIEHRHFYDIPGYLRPGDVLVLNDSRVIPARLRGRRSDTGGGVELLLLHPIGERQWECLARPARPLVPGVGLVFGGNGDSPALHAEIVGVREQGIRRVCFSNEALFEKLGYVPLPPYIHTPVADAERYQTVYARSRGSAAAPTAGLHFTPELLEEVQARGISTLFTTLHIGLDTFHPVHEEDPRCHHIHREFGCLTPEVADAINRARAERRRIIAVGTTSVRVVEQAAAAGNGAGVYPFHGWAGLFILPGFQFKAIDCLITNFHLPRSTLFMLVSAFAGKELIDRAYREAIRERYRFYSFGDCMLIL